MPDRPILRLIKSTPAGRIRGKRRSFPQAKGPGHEAQAERFRPTFNRLQAALRADNPAVELRQDPAGIAPERALVFETAGPVSQFAKVARAVGIELFSEIDLDETDEFPDGFEPPANRTTIGPTFYATMPTLDSLEQLVRLRGAYERGETAPTGSAPWWKLFDLLLDLRPWGPEDRFSEGARVAVSERLPDDDEAETVLELEIWPTKNTARRAQWRREVEAKIHALNGRVLDQSSIDSDDFVYEAVLAGLSTGSVRTLIENPHLVDGLATVEGIQFILPQTIAQAPPSDTGDGDELRESEANGNFDAGAPIRAVLFDGTPVAAHPALEGGIQIEDIHDLVRLSQVEQRYHATSMASLILRGDLEADGAALVGSRLASVPVLVDAEEGASSPPHRLFVDILHTSLLRLFKGEQPLTPEAFVVNLSIGTFQSQFAGQISALARLLDWWSWKEGVLFVISIGNIVDDLILDGVNAHDLEVADSEARKTEIRTALRDLMYDRTLLSPSESINGISVGAVSEDLAENNPPEIASILRYESPGDLLPPVSNAIGLGPRRCLKPDILVPGGIQEFRVWPDNESTRLRLLNSSQRTGLNVAAPHPDGGSTVRLARGTSCAAALTTRALVQSSDALTGEDGPFEGRELNRRDYALLTRALAVNSARWPQSAEDFYEAEKERVGWRRSSLAKTETARFFGHGVMAPRLMTESPDLGVTLVGLGDVRK